MHLSFELEVVDDADPPRVVLDQREQEEVRVAGDEDVRRGRPVLLAEQEVEDLVLALAWHARPAEHHGPG